MSVGGRRDADGLTGAPLLAGPSPHGNAGLTGVGQIQDPLGLREMLPARVAEPARPQL
jgi:hypothetical protein